ncbi:flavodoxin family protein [Vogesella sp. DC21W]|uniref:Flavoprotein WrbA n=1 Tax=Vogesella aquatica TaxID=2984206 RepID=A0ABT5J1Z7_9NEIS|nr:flavodoxin family protein [Vogesella aquatica]MDC7718682.1 flavodoxin family protein [Vogesella aquatica]
MKIVVVYHSGSGHTEVLARAVARGVADVPGTEVSLLRARDAPKHWETLRDAEAIVFGAPTYMGSVSAEFKHFMEWSREVRGQWRDKLAAGFTNSASQSGDKLNTLVDLAVFAAQHGMYWVSLGLKAGNNASIAGVADINRLGSFLGAMAQSNADQGPELTPPASDVRTAELLGQRVAGAAQRWVAGRETLGDKV